jgi:hypothetical protein
MATTPLAGRIYARGDQGNCQRCIHLRLPDGPGLPHDVRLLTTKSQIGFPFPTVFCRIRMSAAIVRGPLRKRRNGKFRPLGCAQSPDNRFAETQPGRTIRLEM